MPHALGGPEATVHSGIGMGMHRDRRFVVEGHPPLPVGVILVSLRVQDRWLFGLVRSAEDLLQKPQEVCALGVWPRNGL